MVNFALGFNGSSVCHDTWTSTVKINSWICPSGGIMKPPTWSQHLVNQLKLSHTRNHLAWFTKFTPFDVMFQFLQEAKISASMRGAIEFKNGQLRSCRKTCLKHLHINQSLKKENISYSIHETSITKCKSICLFPNCVALTPIQP